MFINLRGNDVGSSHATSKGLSPLVTSGKDKNKQLTLLKVPKREIFDRSDFPDFYTIKSLCVGDFGVKIKKN